MTRASDVGETRQEKRIILSLLILLAQSNNVHIHNELATCITVSLSSALESIPQPIDSATLSSTRPPPRISHTLSLSRSRFRSRLSFSRLLVECGRRRRSTAATGTDSVERGSEREREY